jgi:uracil-DNA glycosylase
MEPDQRKQAFRELAADLAGIDLPVYQQFGKDPRDPIIGEGEATARIALFGRDPGRDEVRRGVPFIGAGGQKVRAVLHRHLYHTDLPDFDASLAVGRYLFWANTVPYKPLGNKAWPQRVKKQFQPLMADLLIHAWRGQDVITLGREAFLWFGIDQPRERRRELEEFWAREDRFQATFPWKLTAPDGKSRELRLAPLPHPSPLNALWYKRFPELLEARLSALEFSLNHWRLDQV